MSAAPRADRAGEPESSASLPPRALIVSIFGLYARESGGWLSVATLIRLMAELGVDETAVRSSISRLKRRGVIDAQRIGSSAGYAIAENTRHVLELGDRRIFDQKHAVLSDGWLLAVFSVPESEREKRHVLRSRLAWLGFGTVSSGVWIAPKQLEDEVRGVLAREGFADYVDLFHADHLGFGDLSAKVSTWWDLDELDALYAQFERTHAGVLTAVQAEHGRKDTDSSAFASYVRALTTWRRLPYLDPGLPQELLPSDWAGTRAAGTFHAIRQRLEEPARRFVNSVRSDG